MLESEKLRREIGEIYKIDLEKYKWDDKLQEKIFNIDLDKWFEDKSRIPSLKMKEVYEKGLNIGYCGLTSRYFAMNFPEAEYYRGDCKLLVGTKNAPNGEHAWIEDNGYVIDSTLMIKMPVSEAEKYYSRDVVLAYDSARRLSEYELYSNAEYFKNKTR